MVVAWAFAVSTSSRFAPMTRLPAPEIVRSPAPACIRPLRVVPKPTLARLAPPPVKRRVLAVMAPVRVAAAPQESLAVGLLTLAKVPAVPAVCAMSAGPGKVSQLPARLRAVELFALVRVAAGAAEATRARAAAMEPTRIRAR